MLSLAPKHIAFEESFSVADVAVGSYLLYVRSLGWWE